MNLRIITKNLGADPEIYFFPKSIFKPYGRKAAMPTAWKLKEIRNLDMNYLLKITIRFINKIGFLQKS